MTTTTNGTALVLKAAQFAARKRPQIAKTVADEVRDANPRLARKFDALYRQKP